MSRNIAFLLILFLFILVGCGVDNGSSSNKEVVGGDATTTLSFTNAKNVTLPENQVAVQTISATDPDGSILIYSITGTDSSLFNINNSTGVLTFKEVPNYDTPKDNDLNNVYEIIVKATDGEFLIAEKITVTVTESSNSDYSSDWFSYLNTLRENSGMTTFTHNALLSSASLNHSKYIDATNEYSHTETQPNHNLFTGTDASDRVKDVGYTHSSVGENISNSSSERSSIDGLFTAIYHRMGFLSFKYDEVGFGEYGDYYTYNMGSDRLASLCNSNFTNSGTYFIFCNNGNKTSKEDYDNTLNTQYTLNPDIVVFPYEGATGIPPVFYEESPDPLPNISMSANPISVHFNPTVNGAVIEIAVTKRASSEIISNSTVNNAVFMDKSSDPNRRFTDNDYSLFPLARFDWGTTYDVSILYEIDGVSKSKEYSFVTKTLTNLHTITENTQNIEVISGEKFHIYFKLNGGTTKLTGDISYSYSTEDPLMENIDSNTYSMKVSGNSGDIVNVTYSEGSFRIILK